MSSSPLSSLWGIIFDEKLLKDDRQPALTINILEETYQLVFLLPKYQFHVQVIVILSLQMLIGSLLGMILYYGIILPKQQTRKNNGTILLIGYGIVIPAALYAPFWIVHQLGIQSVLVRLGCISISMTIPLRCLKAMHTNHIQTNNEPSSSISCRDYILATSFIFQPTLDEKGRFIPFTTRALSHALRTFLIYMVILSMVCSILAPVHYSPFPDNPNSTKILSLYWGEWYNAFVQAVSVNLVLQFSLSGTATLAGLYTGIQYKYRGITNHSMFCSKSPSDFWGRRWNNLVHTDLKRGVYIPLRQRHSSRVVAGLMTFLMSGLLHEHVWFVFFFDKRGPVSYDEVDINSNQQHHYWFGKQLLFFGWNGILLSLEYLLGSTIGKIFQKAKVPSFIRSHLVVLLALPLGHLFTTDLTLAGGFVGLQLAVPMMTVVAL